MRILLINLFIVCVAVAANAQCNSYYPMKEGVRFEYSHYDKKDKLSLKTVNTFKDVKGSGSSMRATMVQEIIDAKKNTSIGTSETEWVCENGILHFTMNSMSMADNGQQPGSPGMDVEVTGDKMDIPSDLKVGQTLNDITYTVKMAVSGVNLMNRTFMVKNRKVETKESVTTPAGTFECFKITFTTTSAKGIGSGTTKTAMWYAKDAGLVKSENYKEDGKFINRQLLTKVSN